MSFAQELKDFTSAFTTGMKLEQGMEDSAAKRKLSEAHTRLYNAKVDEAALPGQISANAQAGTGVGALAGATATDTTPSKPLTRFQQTEMQGKLMPTVEKAAAETGIPVTFLTNTFGIESGWNPNAKNPNSSAAGIGQFTRSTAARYGLKNPYDANASIYATAKLAADNAKVLGTKDPAMLYLAHQQGAGGAKKLLTAPANARAVDVLGREQVLNNGGRPDMTVGQFRGLWTDRFNRRADAGDLAIPEELDTLYGASGGLVRHFEDGGVVDPYDRLDTDMDVANLPDAGQRTTTGATPINFKQLDPGVIDAVDTTLRQAGLMADGQAVADPQRARVAYAKLNSPEFKATPQDVQQLHQTVDPLGKLDTHMKQIASYNALYNHYQSRGEADKAQRMVAGLWMATQDAVREAGAYARAHGERGDIAGAVRAIKKGYELTPDGKDLNVTKVTPQGAEFQFKDADGNVTQEGKASVDDIMRIAGGMQDGSAFLQQWNLLSNKTAAQTKGEDLQKTRAAFDEASVDKGMYGQYLGEMDPKAREQYSKLPTSERMQHYRAWEKEFHGQAQANRWRVTPQNAPVIRKHQGIIQQASDLFQNAAVDEPTEGTAPTDPEALKAWTANQRAYQGQQRIDLATQKLSEIKNDKEREIAARAIGLPGLGGKATAKEGAESRAKQAIQVGADRATNAIVNADLPADPAEMTDVERQDIYGKRQYKAGAIRAGAAFENTVRGDKSRNFDPNVTADAETFIQDHTAKDKQVPEFERTMMANIATNLYRANDVDHKLATTAVINAVRGAEEPKILPDGTVQLDPRLPPVKMDRQSLLQLATLRGRSLGETNTAGVEARAPSQSITSRNEAIPATPGATAPVKRTGVGAIAEVAGERGIQQERAALAARLGGEYKPTMSIEGLRALVKQLDRNESRSEIERRQRMFGIR